MDLRIALKLTVLEGKLFLRNYINVFFLLLFPSLILLLFGGMFGNEPAAIFGGYGTVDVSVPAYAGMIISVTGLMCLPLTLSEYREKKILKRFRATPLSPHYVIIAQIGVNLLMTVVGMLLLFITARIVFDLHFMGIFTGGGGLSFSTLASFRWASLIAAVAQYDGGHRHRLPGLLSHALFHRATIPIEMMPETMQKIAAVLPVTHVVKAMKAVWLGESIASVSSSLLLLAGIMVVCSLPILQALSLGITR